MRKIAADIIYPVDAKPIKDGVVIVDGEGRVLALDKSKNHDPDSVERHEGIIIPGFVNTHCHLELSHMKGVVATGTGLMQFINEVVTKRDMPAEVIQQAIKDGEEEMLHNGIVAVGDISNSPDTFPTKERGRMRYYTFVEMFDLFQNKDAQATYDRYRAVYDQHQPFGGSRKSIVPHAPYSVSNPLFEMIRASQPESGVTLSIHNQETPDEMRIFLDGKGGFPAWYSSFGLDLDDFHPTGKSPIHYAMQYLSPDNRNLFVHNTLVTPADIQAAQAWSKHTYWASCPNANLYIENRLPNYGHFIDAGAKVTLGTDSLTSNWQLCILEEMKTISRYQSYVPFETLLRWATLNGAEALGFESDLGSITTGKRPGLSLLQHFDGELNEKTSVKRLI